MDIGNNGFFDITDGDLEYNLPDGTESRDLSGDPLSPDEALIECVNRYGIVDLRYMSSISGQSLNTLISQLRSSAIYRDPEAFTGDQYLLPIGLRFEWNEVTTKRGWRKKNSLEVNYLRTFGDTSVNTSLHAAGVSASGATTPLSDKHAWEIELRHDARKDNFTWSLNAGGRISDHQKDLRFGTTLTWDL